jgi:hypothetical protein
MIINILREKNGNDQLQEFIWQISQSKASVDAADLAGRASAARARADTAAGTCPGFSSYINLLRFISSSTLIFTYTVLKNPTAEAAG